jgi:hypothetical protein
VPIKLTLIRKEGLNKGKILTFLKEFKIPMPIPIISKDE